MGKVRKGVFISVWMTLRQKINKLYQEAQILSKRLSVMSVKILAVLCIFPAPVFLRGKSYSDLGWTDEGMEFSTQRRNVDLRLKDFGTYVQQEELIRRQR